MTAVRQVFDTAIHLMDAQNHSNGQTDTPDNRAYLLRTPALINSLQDRVFSADADAEGLPGSRPECPRVTDIDDKLDLEDRLAFSVLPYGLAGLLLSEEDPVRADFFWQTFQEHLLEARFSVPALETSVTDLYGGVGENRFGAWP